MVRIMGIESSCDDSAVGIIDDHGKILANIVYSQIKEHKEYKGVVPEIAARTHSVQLYSLINLALSISNTQIHEVNAFAGTGGPGLIGGLMVGTTYAKILAALLSKPYLAINHLEAHILSPKIDNIIPYPYLMLLVSGGHCQFIAVNSFRNYKILGSTLDDSIGETFDKVARLLNLEYPGGPAIEKIAKLGNMYEYKFPLPLINQKNSHMSFSGLKTAVLYLVQKLGKLDEIKIANIAASFQYTIACILREKTKIAIQEFENIHKNNHIKKSFAIAGGVAANSYIRNELKNLLENYAFDFYAPKLEYCTDNGAMICYTALEYFKLGLKSELNFSPKPRWPVESLY